MEKVRAFFKGKKKTRLIVLVVFFLLLIVIFVISTFPKQDLVEESNLPESEEILSKSRYENYSINLPDGIVEDLNNYALEQLVFKVKLESQRQLAENFVKVATGESLNYREEAYPALSGDTPHTLDQSLYYWENEEDVVFYDVASDILYFKFTVPKNVPISNGRLNFDDELKLLQALEDMNEKFLSKSFDYEIDNVTTQGNFYRINFSRLLNDIPLFSPDNNLYILLTPDGRLKEGRLLLAEFEESGRSTVLSSSEIKDFVESGKRIKDIRFEFTEAVDIEKFDEYLILSITGEEKGEIDVENGILCYYYTNKFMENIYPAYLLMGFGFMEIDNEKLEAEFNILVDLN